MSDKPRNTLLDYWIGLVAALLFVAFGLTALDFVTAEPEYIDGFLQAIQASAATKAVWGTFVVTATATLPIWLFEQLRK